MTVSPEVTTSVEVPSAPETDQIPDIDELRTVLDGLDTVILDALRRRQAVSQAIGKQRMAEGGPRIVQSREREIIERYSVLGAEGKDLALVVLAMGRGKLGRPIQ